MYPSSGPSGYIPGMKTKPQKHSRRKFLGTATGIFAASPLLGAQADRVVPRNDATLNLINGRIHTMNGTDTVATAVSIRNGRFISVGNTAPIAGADTRVIDLKGRTVVPGLIEAHIHSVSLGNRPGYHTILENTVSIREVQEALAARRRNVPAGQWITSMGGWHPNQWAERRHPTMK